jgi:hypothetical protein
VRINNTDGEITEDNNNNANNNNNNSTSALGEDFSWRTFENSLLEKLDKQVQHIYDSHGYPQGVHIAKDGCLLNFPLPSEIRLYF